MLARPLRRAPLLLALVAGSIAAGADDDDDLPRAGADTLRTGFGTQRLGRRSGAVGDRGDDDDPPEASAVDSPGADHTVVYCALVLVAVLAWISRTELHANSGDLLASKWVPMDIAPAGASGSPGGLDLGGACRSLQYAVSSSLGGFLDASRRLLQARTRKLSGAHEPAEDDLEAEFGSVLAGKLYTQSSLDMLI